MILLREDIAWVRHSTGNLTPFDNARLAASIQQAAELAGHDDWLLPESVAAAMHRFALDCQTDRTIAAGEVTRIVISILTMLGCADVARAYVRQRSQTEIRLDELVTGGDTVIELEFYRQLDAVLRAVAADELALVEVRGLRACVMRLRGAQRWSASCRALADDIVDFVRARAVRAQADRNGEWHLSVLE